MKSKKVLIVDDNELNRKLFENLLGQVYDYESVHDGLQAVEMATKVSFDLILMDIQMPKLDGIKAMKRIREHPFGSCPILAVTAYADESDKQSFLDQGFDDFITKPIRPREFLEKIQSYFQNSFSIHPGTATTPVAPIVLNKSTLNQLLKYNSKEFISKIYFDFLDECLETSDLIAEFRKDGICPELLGKIHTLKGNSGTLGAEKIYRAALICETLGRQKKVSEFVDKLDLLKNEIEEFREFLNQETIFES
jgi:two-component system alkaline phosphatase synthesis response regulator PhoP